MIDGCDHTIINRSPQEAQSRGISTVYQEITLCPNLSVAENMFIGRTKRKNAELEKNETPMQTEFCNHSIFRQKQPQQLANCSIAIQQMVAIARAVDMDCKVAYP